MVIALRCCVNVSGEVTNLFFVNEQVHNLTIQLEDAQQTARIMEDDINETAIQLESVGFDLKTERIECLRLLDVERQQDATIAQLNAQLQEFQAIHVETLFEQDHSEDCQEKYSNKIQTSS